MFHLNECPRIRKESYGSGTESDLWGGFIFIDRQSQRHAQPWRQIVALADSNDFFFNGFKLLNDDVRQGKHVNLPGNGLR